jgi:hypothetical protein
MECAMSVTSLADHRKKREESAPHVSGEAVCMACKHEWVAVARIPICDLECPNCKCFSGRYRAILIPEDREIFHCNCGNNHFLIAKAGVFCPCCGLWVDPS